MDSNNNLKEKALSMLTEEYGSERAQTMLGLVEQVYREDLRDAFYSYVETGIIPDYEYDGKTFEYVMNKTYSTVLGTFPYFDSLMKLEIFRKNFDIINFGKK